MLELKEEDVLSSNPELDEFKVKVIETSKKYASRHGLCGVVDEALKEMGLPTRAQAAKVGLSKKVTVTATVPVEVTLDIPASVLKDYVGKTAAEQNALTVAYLTDLVSKDASKKSLLQKGLKFEGVAVNDVALATSATGSRLPEGVEAFYTSLDGRVRHLFRISESDRTDERRYVYALCGVSNRMNRLQEESPRGSGGTCAKCYRVLTHS